MGVYSDGSYNVPAGLIYSFPVTCRNGEWTIVQGTDAILYPVFSLSHCFLLLIVEVFDHPCLLAHLLNTVLLIDRVAGFTI